MLKNTNQNNANIEGSGNKIVGGNDNSQTNNYFGTNGKLSTLFEKLKASVENSEKIIQISDDLKRYTTRRDTIGLEEKLKNADKSYLYEDFAWLKQEFHKKLVYYQNYEPAQEIFAFILAIVLEKYTNLIKPMLREGISEREILSTISSEIVNPILSLIEQWIN